MIEMILPDGSKRQLENPMTVVEFAKSIGSSLGKATVGAVIDGVQVDPSHIIDKSGEIEIITNTNEKGIEIIRHSAAHIMAQAVQRLFPNTKVTIGPVVENGFFYDFDPERPFTEEDLAKIEEEMASLEDEETNIDKKQSLLPTERSIKIKNLSFSYNGSDHELSLKRISLFIPAHKVTAIVGASGCGKTTLIKLLQGFYEPMQGSIEVGGISLSNLNPHTWRAATGSVMQDSFIFSDTIAGNIAVSTDNIDNNRMINAARMAHINDFIQSLPQGYDTIIGMEGKGISQGQKQRILIARAIYKNPEYIFLDEATNSLDATN